MSNLRDLETIKNFLDAQSILGNRQSKKLCYATSIERRDEDTIAVKQHFTDILTYKRNGEVIYNTGGWHTSTTKQRLGDIGPLGQIWQQKRIWYFDHNGETLGYADGMSVYVDDTGNVTAIVGAIENTKQAEKEKNKLDRKFKKYVTGYVDALLDGILDKPSAADCFYCVMREVETNKPLGEVTNDFSHIESHIQENYFVPSLLINAIEFKPVSEVAKYVIAEKMYKQENCSGSSEPFGEIAKEQITKSLLAYIRHEYDSARSKNVNHNENLNLWTIEKVKKELPPIKVRIKPRQIVWCRISGRLNPYATVSYELWPPWHFTWCSIVHALNNNKPLTI